MASRVKVVAPLSQAVNTPIQMSPTPRFEVLSGPPDDVANVANIPIPPGGGEGLDTNYGPDTERRPS